LHVRALSIRTLLKSVKNDSRTSIFVDHDGVLSATLLLFSTSCELFHVLEFDLERSKHWAAFHGGSSPLGRTHLGNLRVLFDTVGNDVAMRCIVIQLLFTRDVAQSVKALNVLQNIPLTAIMTYNICNDTSLCWAWAQVI